MSERDEGSAFRRGYLELDFDPTAQGEHWLSHCHGYLVDGPGGDPLGVVDEVRVDPSTGRAASLEIAAGWFGRRRFMLAVEDVRAILPLERRLVAGDRAQWSTGADEACARAVSTHGPESAVSGTTTSTGQGA